MCRVSLEKRDVESGIDAIEADERILESDVVIFAKDDMNETTMSTLVLQSLVTVPLRGHREIIFRASCLAFSLRYLSLRPLFFFFFFPSYCASRERLGRHGARRRVKGR